MHLLDLSEPEPSARPDNYIKRTVALLLLRLTYNTTHLLIFHWDGWGLYSCQGVIASWCHSHLFPVPKTQGWIKTSNVVERAPFETFFTSWSVRLRALKQPFETTPFVEALLVSQVGSELVLSHQAGVVVVGGHVVTTEQPEGAIDRVTHYQWAGLPSLL